MAEASVPRRGVQAPYFFLSYGRTPSAAGDTKDPDAHLVRFYRDLCRHIMQLTDLEGDVPPGFLDRRTNIGSTWPQELRKALACCQVLVPVYSPRFMTSNWCGMEWYAFEQRQEKQRRNGKYTRNAVVPVLWVPVAHEELPAVLREIQYSHEDMGHAYRKHGLYGLMIQRQWGAYDRATLAIARSIVDVARSTRLETCDTTLFDELRNSFGEES